MKTLVVSVMIAITSIMNVLGGNITHEFAYNSKTNSEGQVVSKVVFKVENKKYLHHHLLYNYTYNQNGRVSQKEVLKWNEITQVFEKQYCLNFNYTEQEVSIEYVAWNNKEKAYSDSKEKAVYQTGENSLSYLTYEWNEKENNWNLNLTTILSFI